MLLGLGSILGTGVFVSLGLAAEAAGPAMLLALIAAALLALANAMSSAQLAAVHPVAGGTYEYGHRFLNPGLGFTAGWLFLCAKTASAAAAAIGFGAYAFALLDLDPALARLGAAGAAALATTLTAGGLRRSNRVNAALVALTGVSLAAFAVVGLRLAAHERLRGFVPFFAPADGGAPLAGLLEATALLFVAFTGYARIATLGEEVRDPRRTIPRAIAITLGATTLLYAATAAALVGSTGAPSLARLVEHTSAPLELLARRWDRPVLAALVAAGALGAMFGVILNLILGLSRVMLAMGRRGDLPNAMAGVDRTGATPRLAVLVAGSAVTALALAGGVKAAWSLSAFTVLLYYGITHLAALRVAAAERFVPRAVAVVGLAGCAFLAFQVEPRFWIAGIALLVAGHAIRLVRRISVSARTRPR